MEGRSIDMDESIIFKRGNIEVRVPAYPDECTYVRIVEFTPDGEEDEHVIWNTDEFRESAEDTLGAAMGAIKSLIDGTYRRV